MLKRQTKMAESAILRQQTLTIMQQIEELKNWHKQQQSKISTANLTVEDEPVNEKFKTQTGKGLKAKDTEHRKSNHNFNSSLTNFDDIPIKVANTNLNEYLENNITPDENNCYGTYPNGEKPKFRFLKKGEGIARFRMGPQKRSKYGRTNNRTLQLVNSLKMPIENPNQHKTNGKIQSNEINTKKNESIATLYPPDLKLDFRNWKGILSSGTAEEIIEKAIDTNQLELFHPNSSIDSSTASIMEKILAIGKKHVKEKEELRVFETIEQHVLDSSFCSTSSYVAKLMENAVMSTPDKKTLPIHSNQTTTSQLNQKQPSSVHSDKVEEEIVAQKPSDQKRPEVPIWTKPETSRNTNNKTQDLVNTDDFEQSLHVRFSEKVDYKSFIEDSQSLNNSNQQKKSDCSDFDESKESKEDDDGSICCSQCSTTYSSSEEDVRPISPPKVLPSLLQNLSVGNPKFQDSLHSQKRKSNSPIEKLIVSDLNTNGSTYKEHAVGSNDGKDEFTPLLSAKLKELEDEIEMYRAENNKLRVLRGRLEKEHKEFQKEKKKYLIEIEEEKKKNAVKFAEEKQKLAKEKLTFERYSKSLSKNPSKDERKEIQGLKEQLTEMKEELNRKESRWGAAQARVRNQVKVLEEDNKKLREEVEALRKKSKHLEFLTLKKKGYNNTKLIHAINKQISNISVEDGDLEKVSTEAGYFNKITEIGRVVKQNPYKSLLNGPTDDKLLQVSSRQNGNQEKKSNTLPMRDHNNMNNKDSRTVQEGKSEVQEAFIEDCSTKFVKEVVNAEGNMEKTYPDGRKEIRYKNGNVKKIDPFIGNEKLIYFNGDVKEVLRDGTIKYYFSESRIWQTTLPDGLEVLDYPNGQVEKRHTSGLIEIVYPNNCKKITYPDGLEEISYADGTMLKTDPNRGKILCLPNGQKEIHTDEFICREYPDGTVKKLYPDGTTETVYSNGRVRLKDKHGNLVMDSWTSANCRL